MSTLQTGDVWEVGADPLDGHAERVDGIAVAVHYWMAARIAVTTTRAAVAEAQMMNR